MDSSADLLDDFSALDVVPSDDSSPEVIPDGPLCQHEDCENVIPWSGRGRKPKFCAEHKRRTETPKDGSVQSTPRRSAKFDARLDDIEASLTKELALFGKGAATFLPVFGCTLVDRSARTAKVMRNIAAKNPKVLEALEVTTKVADAIDLGEAGLALGVALLVDIKRMNPDGAMPRILGVSETYHALYDEESPTPQVFNGANPFEVSVPPRFQAVN